MDGMAEDRVTQSEGTTVAACLGARRCLPTRLQARHLFTRTLSSQPTSDVEACEQLTLPYIYILQNPPSRHVQLTDSESGATPFFG
jgi:hypothetical protein